MKATYLHLPLFSACCIPIMVAVGLGGRVRGCDKSGDFAEGNAAHWGVFASDAQPTSVANSTERVKDGRSSLLFVTASGFDTGLKYPATANLDLNVSGFNVITFWEYPENNTPIGWQGNQPVILIRTTTGTIQLAPAVQQTPNFDWYRVIAPLAGGNGWTRTTTGSPDLSHVTQIEIHHDTWDFGFKLWLDGLRFADIDPDDLPPAGPPPPAGVDPAAIHSKVLLYVMNPIMENFGGIRMHQVYGWQDPVSLAEQVRQDLLSASSGKAAYQITETVVADEYPLYQDGFRHNDLTFAKDWQNRVFHSSVFDYVAFGAAHSLGARVDAGDFDEVWIYAPPISGMFEASMAGQGAYWINGTPYPAAGGKKAFAIMGWNFERGVAEALHSWGHRAESIMVHGYGPWLPNRDNLWNRFTLLEKDAPGLGGVGNIHFPVNGQFDYDYSNPRFVGSNADAWLAYPNLNNTTRSFNFHEWSPSGVDPHRDYLKWWYGHMPHLAGRGPDYYLANWWRYLLDIDPFKFGSGSLYLRFGSPKVALTYPAAAETLVTGETVTLRAEAEVDGAMGRVDFYIDGIYRGSDSLAPYTLSWTPRSGDVGAHTLVAKAYELQNGAEGVSTTVNITVIELLRNIGITRPAPGTLRFHWSGVPGASHRIESSLDLSGTWTTLTSVVADGSGAVIYDLAIPGSGPRRFLRLAYP